MAEATYEYNACADHLFLLVIYYPLHLYQNTKEICVKTAIDARLK